MSARRELWAEAVLALGLSPQGAERGVVCYASGRFEVRLGLLDPELPVEIRVQSPPQPEALLFLPRQSALLPSAVRTGDRAFDDEVAVVMGGEALLVRLGPAERAAIRQAAALGAQLDERGAWLSPQATARLASVGEIREAIERSSRAVLALRPPQVEEVLRRCLAGPDTPEVDGAARAWLEAALTHLPVELLGPVTAVWMRQGASELPPRLVERALSLWRDKERKGVADILCEILASRGPGPAFRQLWEHRSVRLDAFVCGMVLQAVLQMDARAWSQLVLEVAPLSRTPLRAGPRLRVRGQEVLLLAVIQRVQGPWLELLLSLHAHNVTDALSLAQRLAWFDDPRVTARLLELLPLRQEPIAALVAERAHRAIRRQQDPEITATADFLEGPLFEALLALPDEALGWIVKLVPHTEELRLRWIARLARSPGTVAEQALLPLLETGGLRERRAAAGALGQVGGQRSLDALDLLARSWLGDSELKAAAQSAVRAIRSRHAPGGLSLASGAGGELSPASHGKTGPRGP